MVAAITLFQSGKAQRDRGNEADLLPHILLMLEYNDSLFPDPAPSPQSWAQEPTYETA